MNHVSHPGLLLPHPPREQLLKMAHAKFTTLGVYCTNISWQNWRQWSPCVGMSHRYVYLITILKPYRCVLIVWMGTYLCTFYYFATLKWHEKLTYLQLKDKNIVNTMAVEDPVMQTVRTTATKGLLTVESITNMWTRMLWIFTSNASMTRVLQSGVNGLLGYIPAQSS